MSTSITGLMLKKFGIAWLPSEAAGFYVNGNQVQILTEPQAFYRTLLDKSEKANQRITLTALYLGTSSLETNLVAAIKHRLDEKPGLKVKVLLDCIRGSRGANNSRKVLLPLLDDFSDSCQISLYHTPTLRGPLLSLLPQRYRELIGLQHIKVYLFDNDVIISGANLSEDYFTNRQDRYMVINDSKELADFVDGLVSCVADVSLRLNDKDELMASTTIPHHPTKSHLHTFTCAAQHHIWTYYQQFIAQPRTGSGDTVVFPLLEMGPLNIHQDSIITNRLLANTMNTSTIHLATGYFNLTRTYSDTLIHSTGADVSILMSHPAANGFYKAKGPAGGIPHAYTYLAAQFLDKVRRAKQLCRVKLGEYQREGWTYHAKGLWLTPQGYQHPLLTLIGSPNFGERSVRRDLECQFLVATTNPDLQEALHRERQALYDRSTAMTESTLKDPVRRTPLWVRLVVWLLRTYF